jgi:hypothetical protein
MKAETERQHNAPQVGFYELLRNEPGADMIKAMFEACGHNVVFRDCTPKPKRKYGLKKTKKNRR